MVTIAGADAVTVAQRYIGTPYLWGGESPKGFDCSGLVQYVFGQLGIGLPRVSHDQARAGTPVPLEQIRPGDLIFSDWEGTPNSHVAIYAGNGQLIEAPQPGQRVQQIPLSAGYRAHVDQIRRVVGGGGGALGGGLGGTASGGQAAGVSGFGLPSVEDIPGAAGIATAVRSLGSTLGHVSAVFDGLLWITKPDNVLRVLVGTAGAALIAVGLGFLSVAAR